MYHPKLTKTTQKLDEAEQNVYRLNLGDTKTVCQFRASLTETDGSTETSYSTSPIRMFFCIGFTLYVLYTIIPTKITEMMIFPFAV